MTIQSSTSRADVMASPVAMPPGQQPQASQAKTAAPVAAPQLSEDDLQLIRAFGAFITGTDGSRPDGTVPIDEPTARMSKEEASILVAAWTEKILAITLKMVKAAAKGEKDRIKKQSESNIERMKEAWRKGDAMRRAAASGRVLGWITKTAALVGAAVLLAVAVGATPFSGGLSTPAVVLASMLFASAAFAMADQISQESGGPTMTLEANIARLLEACEVPSPAAKLVSQIVTGNLAAGTMALAEEAGASKEATLYIGLATTIAVTLVMMALTCGAGSSTAAAQGASAGTQSVAAAKTATQTAVQLTQAGTTAVSAAGTTGQGVIAVQSGLTQAEIDELRAQGLDAEAMMTMLQMGTDLLSDYLQEIMKNLGKSNERVAEILESLGQTSEHILAAMMPGGRRDPA